MGVSASVPVTTRKPRARLFRRPHRRLDAPRFPAACLREFDHHTDVTAYVEQAARWRVRRDQVFKRREIPAEGEHAPLAFFDVRWIFDDAVTLADE